MSDANCGPSELRWHVKVFEKCKRVLGDSTNGELAGENSEKEIVKRESS